MTHDGVVVGDIRPPKSNHEHLGGHSLYGGGRNGTGEGGDCRVEQKVQSEAGSATMNYREHLL
jgi:hypothetical protein